MDTVSLAGMDLMVDIATARLEVLPQDLFSVYLRARNEKEFYTSGVACEGNIKCWSCQTAEARGSPANIASILSPPLYSRVTVKPETTKV